MVGYKVITSAVRAEGTKWRGFADTVTRVNPVVQNATLGETAFFMGDPVTLALGDFNGKMLSDTYEALRSYVETALAGAAVEFDQIDEALQKTAQIYDQAEAITEIDLKQIYGTVPR
ncbi:hypothetical protein VSH64_34735 [Amycolatopsis rhabdoformis]|uniref:Uncharacterized protein n=1 Tax=Amycolatopsis rhabdoformis TaxID=1448059 RepID=A0ABZ1I0S3_9PSEU|nr:hypothetical protein [Amycolatopsis rhabdoformis]WSE27974.1 hypothetical protein VSH64_34735 [Amycolatopsis rhabdoformis]